MFFALLTSIYQSVGATLFFVGSCGLPSGNLTQLWKITIFNGKIHYFNGHVPLLCGKCENLGQLHTSHYLFLRSLVSFRLAASHAVRWVCLCSLGTPNPINPMVSHCFSHYFWNIHEQTIFSDSPEIIFKKFSGWSKWPQSGAEDDQDENRKLETDRNGISTLSTQEFHMGIVYPFLPNG